MRRQEELETSIIKLQTSKKLQIPSLNERHGRTRMTARVALMFDV
jgi:hypothetical protein